VTTPEDVRRWRIPSAFARAILRNGSFTYETKRLSTEPGALNNRGTEESRGCETNAGVSRLYTQRLQLAVTATPADQAKNRDGARLISSA
jgi:hypothetical protein